MSQANVNIAIVGHVDHGKTSLLYALSGKWADTHSEEIKRGITIRLGYADVNIYKCDKCTGSQSYKTEPKCLKHGIECKRKIGVSFIDAPGHETLMTTMISGASIVDGAILVIAANEDCPQPQTKEHLMALDIIGVKKIIIVQNKIDVVTEEQALKNHNQIKEFTRGTVAEDAPTIPVSAQHNANIDVLLQKITEIFKPKSTNPNKEMIFLIARSFNINKPGKAIKDLEGGVIGGALKQGKIEIGDDVTIIPGVKIGDEFKKLETKVVSLNYFGERVEKVNHGGSLGIETDLDPSLTKADRVAGQILVKTGEEIEVKKELDVKVHLLERVVGTKEELRTEELKNGEPLVVSAWTARTLASVVQTRKDGAVLRLKNPVAILPGEKIALSKMIGNRWRLIGYGVVK